MLNINKIVFAVLLCTLGLNAQDAQVIKLTPPQITSTTILEEIVCTRPMREGKFNISLEKQGNKTIVNCYGHGGSGWTTLFGSVNKALALYDASHPDKKKPIRIIGSGCMGLTTAIELTRLGYHVKGIYTKDLYNIPSWRAAGYFALVSVKTSPEEQNDLNEIGLNTFLTYQQIEKGQHPYICKEAVKFMPVYCSVDTEAGVEDLEQRGMIPAREYVTLDFGNGVIHPDFVKYMTYFMNTSTLMQELQAEVKRLGIQVENQTVRSFDEISEEVIFNCAGLGGKDLNADKNMIPVRGHLITLKDSAGADHMDYMIYSKVKQEGRDEYIYLFPKNLSVTAENPQGLSCQGVLGGTFIPQTHPITAAKQQELDRIEFKRMLDRNSEFFLGHPYFN